MFSLIFHPLLLLRFLGMFILWYVFEMPVRIVRMYAAYAHAFGEIFSFRFLIRTLFSLWKGIADEYPRQGIHIEKILGTFCLNTISRVIGCIFRIFAIILGISVQMLCFVMFFVALVAWIAYPIGAFLGVRFLFQTLSF